MMAKVYILVTIATLGVPHRRLRVLILRLYKDKVGYFCKKYSKKEHLCFPLTID